MMEGWKEVKLKDVADIVGGGTPSSQIDSYWNGSINWITPADLSGYMFKHISSGERNISEIGLAKSSAKLHPKGTVLMTSRAPIGYLAIASDEVATNQGFQSFRCKPEKVDNHFLYYILHLYKDGLQAIASGATFPEVSGKKVKGFKINLPPLPTQRKIAAILSAYDDLIENNLKRIKLLEEKAQLTYEEWFVRMRFPGHETTPIDEEAGLPEGWEKVKMGEALVLNYGKALKKTDRIAGDYNVYGSSGIVGNHNQYLVKGPGLIVGRKGNVGSVFRESRDFYAIDTVYYVSSRYSLNYIYYNLKKQSFINNDAAVPGLNRNSAYLKNILIPSDQILEKFELITSQFFNLIDRLEGQNQLLKEARDILLPRLMTGMIDVEQLSEHDF